MHQPKYAPKKQMLFSVFIMEICGIGWQPERNPRHSDHSNKRYPDGDPLRGCLLVYTCYYTVFVIMIRVPQIPFRLRINTSIIRKFIFT